MKPKSMLILGAVVAAAGAALLYRASQSGSVTAGIVGMSIRRQGMFPLSFHDAHADAPTYYDGGIDPANVDVQRVYSTPETKQDRIYWDGQKFVEGKRVVAFSRP